MAMRELSDIRRESRLEKFLGAPVSTLHCVPAGSDAPGAGKRRRTAAVLAGVLLCAASIGCQRVADERGPNVVLFLVDDMGWMDCGVYGSEYYETPNIDRLATRGMLFTDAYSASPLCSPSRASILTGKYPARLGLTTARGHEAPRPAGAPRYRDGVKSSRPILVPQSLHYLDPAELTLAEVLNDAGYATGHFGKWHLGLNPEHWPEQQGYDVAWHGAPDNGPPSPNGYFSPYSFDAGTITPGPEGEYLSDRLTDETIGFIEGNRDRPFFAFVSHFGVHGPWDHKQEYTEAFAAKTDPRGEQGNPIMASMLRSIDESLGRIVATLDELGLSENTIILFASDNGGNIHSNTPAEPQKDNIREGSKTWRSLSSYREFAGYLPPTNNAPLRGGKGSLFEGGVRIPLIAVWPGEIPAGTTSSELVSTIDFYSTLLDLAGLPPNDGRRVDGISLAPVLHDPEQQLSRDAVFNFFPHGGPLKPPPGVTVRRGRWKLIRWFHDTPEHPELRELYNLDEDIGETKDVSRDNPGVVDQLDSLIDGFLRDTEALVPIPNPKFDG
jgi:arylsulfatase A-like enzyme